MNDIIERLKKIINVDSPIVLEIGSHNGKDSLRFLQVFENINLLCFEPDPKNCNDHRTLINDKRCTLIEAAISDEDGDATFHLSGGKNRRASGSLRFPRDHLWMHPWCTFNEDLIVKGHKLDTWCEQNGIDCIDLIWADVNGAETSMISGAQRILKKTRYLYTEFGPDGREVYEGGVTKNQIKALLPDFEEILVNTNNILLRNRRNAI